MNHLNRITSINGSAAVKIKNRFTSYLDESVQSSDDVLQRSLKPKMLQGEIEACRAERVLLCPPLLSGKDSDDSDVEGLLVITNFKLTFITNDESQNPNFICQDNLFLGRNDVTLSNIDHIYQVVDKKKKLLTNEYKISSRIDFLVVVCKNFRMFRFGFSRSGKGAGKYVAEALLKLPFPNNHTLLFGYRFKEKYYNTLRNMSLFDNKGDWVQELMRCGARNFNYENWRVLTVDTETRLPMRSLPLHYVVPKSLADCDYLKAAEKFRDSRNAVWVYGYENASLIRMAELLPDITDNRTENSMFECIRKCHPEVKEPALMELTKYLPSVQDVGEGYRKLRQLCTPDTAKLFRQQDDKFLKSLEGSCWLLYASLCLQYADVAARHMRCNGNTVILQENDGRDMCCVISSLTQILLDPYCRTINGFQSLIQKEWVALGHPFCDRLGHVANEGAAEQSPLFLLFLDCVWQLTQQFSEEFEFSETFLTTLWDATFMPIFDTFLFNCEHDRLNARKDGLIMRPVWDWGEQFADKDILFFTNPLYKRAAQSEATPNRKSVAVLPASAVQLPCVAELRSHPHLSHVTQSRPMSISALPKVSVVPVKTYLEPKFRIQNMELWRQCYLRWLPIVEIQGGGPVQIELFHRLLMSNVNKLQTALQTREFEDLPPRIISPVLNNEPPQSTGIEAVNDGLPIENGAAGGGCGITPGQIMPSVNSFFPFSRHATTESTDLLNLSNELLMDGSVLDMGSQTQLDREEPHPQLWQQPWALPQPEEDERVLEVSERRIPDHLLGGGR